MARRGTIAEARARHQKEIRGLVLGALERSDWRLQGAARDLDVAVSTLQGLIASYDLAGLYAEHRHGRGRPRSAPGPVPREPAEK